MAGEAAGRNLKRPTREEVAKNTIDRLKRFSEHLESGRSVNEAYSCRKIVLDVHLEPYTPEMVKAVRKLFNVSQGLFAQFMNVKTTSIRKWEQGISRPNGAATRLLDEYSRNPEFWLRRFREMARTIEGGATK